MAKDGLVKTPFTLDKNTTGVTFVAADFATATTYTTVLTYSVPLGMAVEITPANYHFGLFYGTGGVTSGDIITAGTTKIEKANATGAATLEIFTGSNAMYGNLGDELKRPRFKTAVLLNASQQLIVSVANMGTTLDVSTSNFFVEAVQVFEDL